MKQPPTPQPWPPDIARADRERMIAQASDKILSTIVDRGIRPDVLQEALREIYTEWDRQHAETFATRLAGCGVPISRSGDAYGIGDFELFAGGEPFDEVLLSWIKALLKKA